ncbi:MAG: tRNA uridine-5-carboxymethylaminomethyl(34) synthesis GTPase MnmE [Rhodospirillaceae bacterium]|nr:tRNA uridine-5-carboxymethylaminomethyl(34) synthesis GTPase MnmE [Rhodospirillaceae bacterium]|tara:strand:+ start:105 stop:1406 length:1302 start_codon:yes stop_codon:yes gene_type:complete
MTIFALSSAPGRAAVAVIRVSGPSAGAAVRTLTARDLPPPRQAVLRRLYEGGEGVIDEALVLWFAGPASETGEDMAEFQVHGGRAVVSGVLGALARIPGLRPAEPGEFTRRALLNGKLDLLGAEAVADLADADTAVQRDQALDQLGGGLSGLYDGWWQRLITQMAHVEALIDFSDEDLPDDPAAGLHGELETLQAEIRAHLADDRRSQRLREGLHVVILGAPNVGKSSLLNRLARRDAAIVASEAGTTRDVVEVTLDLGGFPVILSDTAGLREQAGIVEQEGMRRAVARAESADLRLVVADGSRWGETWQAVAHHVDEYAVIVANKSDLADGSGMSALPVSCETGEGLDGLVREIETRLHRRWNTGGPGPTRERHRAGLEQALLALDRAGKGEEAALIAEDLRLAATALGRITGRVDVEDLLDVIFAEFCIGK